MKTSKKEREAWHSLFGSVIEKRYAPVGLTVHSHFRLMSEPPEADVAIISRKAPWTEAQYNVLPDGIRQLKALCYLLEFKMTESLNRKRIEQALLYHLAYKRTQNLTNAEVQTFVISSYSTHKKRLAEWGYEPTEISGVYHNSFWVLRPVKILLLNELSPEPHNAFIKCFASRETEKRKAFATVYQELKSQANSDELYWFMVGLWHKMFRGEEMSNLITTEDVLKMGRAFALRTMPLSEILSYHKPEDVMSGFKPEERLIGLKPEEVLTRFKPEERLIGLKPEERLIGLKPEERLVGLKPEQRLAGLSPDEIRAYLKQLEA